MCGLVGIFNLDDSGVLNADVIQRMRDTLAHRGPDDSGLHLDKRVGLAFRRLSIIDIEGGHQPMIDDETGVAVVYNGEVYNYKELRRQLEALGQRFTTNSDTEVVLRSYLQWGSEMMRRFFGQFAFAIWDPRSQEVLLVRDRLGIKPLYWTRLDTEILFASEIKAFFQHPKFRAQADFDAISSYLTFRQAVWDLCFFKGVNKVLPGYCVSLSSRGINERSYWELPVPVPDNSLTEAEYQERIEGLLTEATSRCLVSDVPVGAYLSGGLDSSLLVAFLHQLSSTPLRTFSIGYEDHEYDEGQHAKAVSDHFHTQHLHVVLPQQDYEHHWLELLRQRDAPLSIPHEIPLYHLSRELKKFVTVAISGEGADELFGGYGRVLRSPMDWNKVLVVRSVLGDPLSTRVAGLRAMRDTPLAGLGCRSHMEHFFDVYNWVPFEEKWNLMSNDVLHSIDHDSRTIGIFREIFEKVRTADPYDQLLYVFEKIHLGCLLDRLDAMSMAAGVEARVPFVDHQLVEFVINMPLRYKLRWNSRWSRSRALFTTAARASEWLDTNKYLLRKLASKRIPATISSRKKLGFPTPLDGWFRNGMMTWARDLLLGKTTRERGIFDHDALARLLANEQNLPYDTYGKKIWMLMNVELWFREFIDKPARAVLV